MIDYHLDNQHQSPFATDDDWLRQIMDCLLTHLPAARHCHQNYELGIALVGEDDSRQLNGDYRGKDKPTNVLSFASDMPKNLADNLPSYPLGDLVICVPVLCREAKEQDKLADEHFTHLLIHGLLHLFGYDHEISDTDCQQMEQLEISILATLGIKNPYQAIDDL